MAKATKTPTVLREIITININSLVQIEYRRSSNMPKDFAKVMGTSTSTAERIMKGYVGMSIDTLESVARALLVSPYQLLIPNLNPRNPQIVKGATKEEEKLYSTVRTLPREILK